MTINSQNSSLCLSTRSLIMTLGQSPSASLWGNPATELQQDQRVLCKNLTALAVPTRSIQIDFRGKRDKGGRFIVLQ